MEIYQSVDGKWVVRSRTTKHILNTYEEAIAMSNQTAIQEWEGSLRNLIGASRGLITEAQSLSLLAQTNDVEQIIAAAEAPGDLLPGTTITKADAAVRAQMFADMMTWLAQPVNNEPSAPTRLAVIFRRF